MQKQGKILIIISIIITIVSLILLCYGIIAFLPLIISGYIFSLGIALLIANEDTKLYAILTATTMNMVAFVCYASYGLAFVEHYIIGIVLSICIFCSKVFTKKEKYIAYISMILVFLSCCYFIPWLSPNLRYLVLVNLQAAMILVEYGAGLYLHHVQY